MDSAAHRISTAFWRLYDSLSTPKTHTSNLVPIVIAVAVKNLELFAALLELKTSDSMNCEVVKFVPTDGTEDPRLYNADLRMTLEGYHLTLESFDPLRPRVLASSSAPPPITATLSPESGVFLPLKTDALHRFVCSLDHFLWCLRDLGTNTSALWDRIDIHFQDKATIYPLQVEPENGLKVRAHARDYPQRDSMPFHPRYDARISVKGRQRLWVAVYWFDYSRLSISKCMSVHVPMILTIFPCQRVFIVLRSMHPRAA